MNSSVIVNALLKRRSVMAKQLNYPGPSAQQLETILQAAHRVPDHGKLGPWRFIVFQGATRQQFGEKLCEIFAADNPEASEKLREIEAQRFCRAPVVIGVISSPVDHPKIPIWEQELSAGAACMNINHAAHALGFASQWLTEWCAFHPQVNALLALQAHERVAGFIYIGTAKQAPLERDRPSLEQRTQYWSGA